MIILIPSSTYRERVPDNVVDSVIYQTVRGNVVVVCTPGGRLGQPKDLKHEIASRMACRTFALGVDPKAERFIAVQDPDILHLRTDNWQCAETALESDASLGAVAFQRDSAQNHVCIGAAVYRIDVLIGLKYDPEVSCCWSVKSCIEKKDMFFKYVDNVPRIRHLTRNRANSNLE